MAGKSHEPIRRGSFHLGHCSFLLSIESGNGTRAMNWECFFGVVQSYV